MLQLTLNKSKLILVFGIVFLFVATIYVHEINQPATENFTDSLKSFSEGIKPIEVKRFQTPVGFIPGEAIPINNKGERI